MQWISTHCQDIRKLILNSNITLEAVVNKANQCEAVHKERALLHKPTNSYLENKCLDRVYNNRVTKTNFIDFKSSTDKTCIRCGGKYFPDHFERCPTIRLTCKKSNKVGNFASVCRSKPSKNSPTNVSE